MKTGSRLSSHCCTCQSRLVPTVRTRLMMCLRVSVTSSTTGQPGLASMPSLWQHSYAQVPRQSTKIWRLYAGLSRRSMALLCANAHNCNVTPLQAVLPTASELWSSRPFDGWSTLHPTTAHPLFRNPYSSSTTTPRHSRTKKYVTRGCESRADTLSAPQRTTPAVVKTAMMMMMSSY